MNHAKLLALWSKNVFKGVRPGENVGVEIWGSQYTQGQRHGSEQEELTEEAENFEVNSMP